MSPEVYIKHDNETPLNNYENIIRNGISRIQLTINEFDNSDVKYIDIRSSWLDLYNKLNLSKAAFQVYEQKTKHESIVKKIDKMIQFISQILKQDTIDPKEMSLSDQKNVDELII